MDSTCQSTTAEQRVLAAYKQTTEHTCADSTYMAAAHEMLNAPMGPEREWELWKLTVPWLLRPLLKKYVGTPPGFLARYIQRSEPRLRCEMLFYRKNTEPLIPSRRWLLGVLSQAHDIITALFVGLRPRARFIRRRQTCADILELLDTDPSTRLLQVIVIEQRLVHYVLVRRNGTGRVATMDPMSGTNTDLSDQEFESQYGAVLYGYSTVLRLVP
jgi:hypothetical protein